MKVEYVNAVVCLCLGYHNEYFSCAEDVVESVTAFEGSLITLRCPFSVSEAAKGLYWITPQGSRIDQDTNTDQ